MLNIVPYRNRAVLRISGRDSAAFLQSMICNRLPQPNHPVFAALLDTKGVILADFFIMRDVSSDSGDVFLLQSSAVQVLGTTLARYKLAADVEIAKTADEIRVLWCEGRESLTPDRLPPMDESLMCFADPRGDVGIVYVTGASDDCARWTAAHQTVLQERPPEDWHRLRMGMGLSDDEYLRVKLLPLNWHFEAFGGINWDKGCYPGQEICARIHFKGAVKKQVFPVRIDDARKRGESWSFPQDIHNAENQTIGQLIAAMDGVGLAFIHQDSIGQKCRVGDEVTIIADCPAWLQAGAAHAAV